MSALSPKPIIKHVHRTWQIPPGMTIALVEDIERCLWVVESCPVGTHFWTLEQARGLSQGARTRRIMVAAAREGQRLNIASPSMRPFPSISKAHPTREIAAREQAVSAAPRRELVRTVARTRQVSRPRTPAGV